MHVLLATIGVWVVSSVIARLFIALGIGLFTYYGLYSLVEQLIALVENAFGGLPSQVVQILSLAGIPECLSIICSAFLTRAALQAVQTFFGTRV